MNDGEKQKHFWRIMLIKKNNDNENGYNFKTQRFTGERAMRCSIYNLRNEIFNWG